MHSTKKKKLSVVNCVIAIENILFSENYNADDEKDYHHSIDFTDFAPPTHYDNIW